MFKTLLQWPPQPTTVIGAGVLSGTGIYLATGDTSAAFLVAGLVKLLVPDNSNVAAQEVEDGIRSLSRSLGRPMASLAAAAWLVGLAGQIVALTCAATPVA
ncbi:MAG: hypothetical protein JO038_06970 [Alphaproteobacteria bacterium]|nr:hypothetical protein [Alphaproteobacteria bacterium]